MGMLQRRSKARVEANVVFSFRTEKNEELSPAPRSVLKEDEAGKWSYGSENCLDIFLSSPLLLWLPADSNFPVKRSARSLAISLIPQDKKTEDGKRLPSQPRINPLPD